MHCANPKCCAADDDLLRGTLQAVEFETTPEERLLYAAGGFPVCAVRTRFFWLCPVCARRFTIRTWNSAGPVLQPLPGMDSEERESLLSKPASSVGRDGLDSGDRLYGSA